MQLKKLLIVSLLAAWAAPASAQTFTRSMLINQNSLSTIPYPGSQSPLLQQGSVSPTGLQGLILNIVQAMGVLSDSNTWTGANTFSGATTITNCVSGCGGNSGVVSSGGPNQLTYYPSAGTTVGPLTTGTGVLTAIGNNVNTAGGLSTSAVTTLSSLTSIGTIATGTWNGTAIGFAHGGTGLTALGSANQCLTTNAGVTAMVWGSCVLSISFPQTVGGTITSGGVPYFNSTTQMSSSALLAANALMIGGGAATAPSTTATGTGALTAIGNAINTTGGFVSQSGTLAANAILLGGGSATAITSTTTATGVVTAIGNAINTTGGFVTQSGTLAAGAILLGGGSATAITSTATGTGVVAALGTNTGVAGGLGVFTGSLTVGHCVNIGTGGTLSDAGGSCTTSGGSGTVSSGTGGQVTWYATTGTTVSGTTTGTGVITAIGNNINTTGGYVTQSGTLAANALLIGGGSATAITSTTTGTGVLTAIGNNVNAAGGLATSAVATLSSLTTVGTIGTGTWQGTAVTFTYGGTGLTALGSANQCLTTNAGVTAMAWAACLSGISFPQTVAGTVTSGGIPYFNSTTQMSSSALLVANAIVIGGGAGTAPATTTTGTGVVTAIGNAVNAAGGLATSAVATLSSLTTVGTIGTGVWQGTAVGYAYGGTGLTALGSANQCLTTNSGATAMAWAICSTISLPVAVGGTVTSGGIPYFNSTTQMSSSALLAANAIVIGGGAGAAPSTTTTGTGVLTAIGNAVNGASGLVTYAITTLPSLTTASALATVGTIGTGVWQGTAVAYSYGGTGLSALGSANQCLTTNAGVTAMAWAACGIVTISLPQTVAGTVTSGGIPYFNSTTQMSSSALLTANAIVIGGGAGTAPSTTTTGSGVLTALGDATNATGGIATYPVAQSTLTGLGSSVSTALAVNIGSSGAVVLQNGAITTGNCVKWGGSSGATDFGTPCSGAGVYQVSCNNTSADTTNINNAITSASTSGGVVQLPAGTCLLTSTVSITSNNVVMRGLGHSVTILNANFTGSDVIDIGSSGESAHVTNVQLIGFSVTITGTQSCCAGIHKYASNRVLISDVDVENMNFGLWLDGTWGGVGNADYNTFVQNSYLENSARNLMIGSGSSTISQSFPQNIFIRDTDDSGATGYGVYVFNVGGLNTTKLQGINNEIGVEIQPGTNQCVCFWFSASDQWDSSVLAGMRFDTEAASAEIFGTYFVDLWIASSGTVGFFVNQSEPGPIQDVTFTGCHFINNQRDGAVIASGTYYQFNGCDMSMNNQANSTYDGLEIHSSDVTVSGGLYGPGFQDAGAGLVNYQYYGIYVQPVSGSITNIAISGANTTGNTQAGSGCTAAYGTAGTGITCSGTITTSQIGGNL